MSRYYDYAVAYLVDSEKRQNLVKSICTFFITYVFNL